MKILEHFEHWTENFENLEKSLVDAFQLLQFVAENRLKKSAISELNREKETHELFQENKEIKKNIKGTHIHMYILRIY